MEPILNDLTNVYPFTISQTFNRVASSPLALTLRIRSPRPGRLARRHQCQRLHAASQAAVSAELHVVDRAAIGRLTSLEVEYDGIPRHAPGTAIRSQSAVPHLARLPNGTSPRPFAGFGTHQFLRFRVEFGLQQGSVTLRRTYRNGLFYGVSYVFSKSIDDASQVSGNSHGGLPGSAEFARSGGRTRTLAIGTPAIPSCSSDLTPRPFRGNRLLRDWQVSTTWRFYTGQPFTPRLANSNLDSGRGQPSRPDRQG